MAFPHTRMRRTRRTPSIRNLVRETTLDAGDLILPLLLIGNPVAREQRGEVVLIGHPGKTLVNAGLNPVRSPG